MKKILRELLFLTLSIVVFPQLVSVAEENVGVRPYELDWANRTTDDNPPLIDFETPSDWKVEAGKSTVSFLPQSREQQIWGKYVAKLTYRGNGEKQPIIAVRPVVPPRLNEDFDAMSCWIYGNNWAWSTDPTTPRVSVHALFTLPDGKEIAVFLAYVQWKEWYLCHHRFTEDEQKLLHQKGSVFSGFQITNGTNTEDRVIYFDNFALFKEVFKPLEFSKRPKRGIDMFPQQSSGQNTGEGVLPFPNRNETILPDTLDKNAQNSLKKQDNAWQFLYQGSDGKMIVQYTPVTGTWSDIKVQWNNSAWFEPLTNGGINFLINKELKQEPIEKREHLQTRVKESTLITDWKLSSATVETTVEYNIQLLGKNIVLDTFAKGGKVPEVSFGVISGVKSPQTFKIPYYSYGGGNRPCVALFKLDGTDTSLFSMAHIDWYRSNASTISGGGTIDKNNVQTNGKTIYNYKTDKTRNDVYERFFISISPNFTEVLPNIPNPISPWKHLTGTKVWRAHGANINRKSDYDYWRNIWRHGMRELVITDHETCWRDSGESFTFRTKPAPQKGGDKGWFDYSRFMQDTLGFTYGPYNNFTDFAPVNGYWSYDMVSRTSDNQLQQAWARCYAPKPARAVEYCEKLSPINEKKFGFSTAYCDVHTAVTPWSRTDYDARVPGAGTFAAVYYPYGEIMLLQKKSWNGPVYSEGPHHCFYSGLTDGNYAQDQNYYFPGNPWLLDFDLLKMHDHECNFGMGNPGMYDPQMGKRKLNTQAEKEMFLDRFLAATIAFGHPGFLTMDFGVWSGMKGYFMVQPIAARYTQSSVESIGYLDANGKQFDISSALANDVFKRSQHIIRYKDGTFVAVNANFKDSMKVQLPYPISVPDENGTKSVQSIELPPNGYFCCTADKKILVQSMDLLGKRGDYSVSPDAIYLNGRKNWQRLPLAAGSGNGVCRILKDGTFEVIVLENQEMGFVIDANKATALNVDGKDIGAAKIRKSRGYLFIEPMKDAFSYRLEKVANSDSSSSIILETDRYSVVAGEKITVHEKANPTKKYEISIPTDAQEGNHLWFEPTPGAFIDFVVIPLVKTKLCLNNERYLAIEATANINLNNPLDAKFESGTVPGKPIKMETSVLHGKQTMKAVFDLGPATAAKQEKGILTITSDSYKDTVSITFNTIYDYKPTNIVFSSSAFVIDSNVTVLDPQSWMQVYNSKPTSEFQETGASVYWQELTCGGITKPGYFIHPPYLNGGGRAWLEYKFTVPSIKGFVPTIRAEVGKRDGSDLGDGILFLAVVLDEGKEYQLAEVTVPDHQWLPLEGDLTPFIGKNITLRLITDPGKNKNTAGDWSCWGNIHLTNKDKEYIRSLVD